MILLALASLALALLPAVVAMVNLASLKAPVSVAKADGPVSILIPARNEAAIIAETVRAALASRGLNLEVLVGDDHSTDGTAEIVRDIAMADTRVRVVSVPPLPAGWTGKNHACSVLARHAAGRWLLFIDADVRLAPSAAVDLVSHAQRNETALLSGVPRQIIVSLGEQLTVPMINFLLLGFLPIPLMRRRSDPNLSAACGQLVLMEAAAYHEAGGHAAIRGSLHDGVMLPRLFRRAGLGTDLVAATDLATCRMYRGLGEAWAGFSKNATEGMATPAALPIWTILLFGGQVLPWLLLVLSWFIGAATAAWIALSAGLVSLATRACVTFATKEPILTIPKHPLAVSTALAIQWSALFGRFKGRSAMWKGRRYPGDGEL